MKNQAKQNAKQTRQKWNREANWKKANKKRNAVRKCHANVQRREAWLFTIFLKSTKN